MLVEQSTVANDVHPPNAFGPMLLIEAASVTLASELQLQKARLSMLVTDAGMATLANELPTHESTVLDAGHGRRNGNAC